MLEIPNSLIPVTEKEIKKLGKTLDSGGLFFLREDGFDQSELYIFGAPVKISDVSKNSFFINPEGSIRFEWFIRPARERSKDLWGSFSEELVMLKLKGNKRKYEVNCGQANAIAGMSVKYQDSYLMRGIKKQDARAGFYFGAREMLRIAKINDLPEQEIGKLAKFLFADYNTMRYTKKSEEIGREADSIFFP